MAGLKPDIMALLAKKVEDITEQAYFAAAETELVGVGAMRDRVTTAITPWGLRRQAGEVPGPGGRTGARPHAGRRETDRMYDAITGETERVSKTRIVTTWGWETPEDYYLYQEHGTDRIAPMEALAHSLDAAEDDLTGRLRRIS